MASNHPKNGIMGFLRIIRPLNSFLIGFGLIIAVIIAGGLELHLPIYIYFSLFFAGFFVTGHAMIINDIVDYEIDLINVPHRVLTSGIMTKKQALIYAIILAILGIALFSVVDFSHLSIYPLNWLWGLFHVLLADLYNLKLKKTGFFGNIIVSYSSFAVFLYADIFFNGGIIPFIFGVMVFFFTLAREILKGIMDMKGDRQFGIRTIAVQFGSNFAKILSIVFQIVCIILGFIIISKLIWIGIMGTIILDLFMFYTLYLSFFAQDPKVAEKVKKVLLYAPTIYSPFILLDRIFFFFFYYPKI